MPLLSLLPFGVLVQGDRPRVLGIELRALDVVREIRLIEGSVQETPVTDSRPPRKIRESIVPQGLVTVYAAYQLSRQILEACHAPLIGVGDQKEGVRRQVLPAALQQAIRLSRLTMPMGGHGNP